MVSILLVVIYIAFISLGLPDSLLGSAWPSMYGELNVPVSYAGVIGMIICGGTIISSLFSHKLINKFSTGVITTISVAMTAVAMLGFSFSNSFWQLCLWGIPYGLGAGSVDAALNNFVAINYKARHMSWLHCFWGVGATVGPYIMALCLTNNLKWNSGYKVIGIIQIILVVGLFFSIPLWKKVQKSNYDTDNTENKSGGMISSLRISGVINILICFFCYCSLEATTGLWASSYLVLNKGIDATTAASWASLYFIGITAGRFLCGFISEKVGDKNMIRAGQLIIIIGIIIMLMPLGNIFTLIGLLLIGFGCAPIYPCMIHETPFNFGEKNSQVIIGMQMASAYVGTTFMSPVFGLIADNISIKLFPLYLLIFVIIMFVMKEMLNRKKIQ